jgi:type I restriction enzyme S subunit
MNDMRTMLIKDLGIIVTGNTPSKSEPEFYNSNDIHFIKPDLIGNTGITQINHSKEYISEKARKKARVVRKNTVLVTCIGNIGKVGFVEVDEVAFNQQINAIIPNKYVLPRYLAYALLANQQRLESIANAPVVPIINKTQFENFDLSIHDDLTEQDKITRILDNISKELMFRQKQINEYDQIIKSRFVEMFGNPVLNDKRYDMFKLNQIGSLNRGKSKHRPRNAPELLGGKYPLIQTGDVANSDLYIKKYTSTYSELGLKQSKLWNKGTLCITIAANIAKTSILDFDACFPDSVVGFIPHNVTNNIFMHYWFSFFQLILESQAPESAQKNINLRILGDLDVIVPPKDLQDNFAQFVEQVDKLKFEVQKSLNETQMLFDSLMQEYFG